MSKISIIGAGNVGAQIAYEIASRNLAQEIVLVDILPNLAAGQALDIQQALAFHNSTKITSGDFEAIQNSEVIVIPAGKPRTPGMSDRLELAKINSKIIQSITSEIKKYSPHSIIVTLTNPLDLMNHVVHQSGFPREKVIGSGSQLDSARFRIVLGHPLQNIEAWVIGEHGEGMIPLFSNILRNGKKYVCSAAEQEEIKRKVKESGLQVIEKKGATIFAPAMHTADIVEAIIRDQKKRMICSVNLQGEYGLSGISLGVPIIVGKNGIEKIEQWDLSAEEQTALQQSSEKLKGLQREL